MLSPLALAQRSCDLSIADVLGELDNVLLVPIAGTQHVRKD